MGTPGSLRRAQTGRSPVLVARHSERRAGRWNFEADMFGKKGSEYALCPLLSGS